MQRGAFNPRVIQYPPQEVLWMQQRGVSCCHARGCAATATHAYRVSYVTGLRGRVTSRDTPYCEKHAREALDRALQQQAKEENNATSP